MKYPDPEGNCNHAWGKRRRKWKKHEKRIFKELARRKLFGHIEFRDCFWENRWLGRHFREYGKIQVPEIRHGWTDYWGEGDCRAIRGHADDIANREIWIGFDGDGWPTRIYKTPEQVLAAIAAGKGGEG